MAVNHRLVKAFQNFKGLDLRSSDLLRESGAATQTLNVDLRQTGALNKRKGHQILTRSAGGYGTTRFNNVNLTTGVITEELLSTDDNLQKMATASFTATYTGTDTAYYDMYLDEDTGAFFFDVYDNNVRVLNSNLGDGKENSFVTVATLISSINGLTNFTCSGATATTEPAAFIPLALNQTIAGTGTGINFQYWTQVSTPTGYSDPFSTHYAARNDSDFENATFASVNDVIYISNGYDDLHKYDGTRVYKAGLPKATTPTGANQNSSSPFTAGRVLRYKIEIEYTDAKENVIYSEISDHLEFTVNGSGDSVDVTYTELAGSAGYDVDGALKYNIYRTDSSADATDVSSYYLIHTADHGDSIPWNDADAALGAAYVEPVKARNQPPKGRYIDVWRNQLIITGKRDDVNTVFYSDIDSAEYFPSVDNSFITAGQIGGTNRGIRALDNILYIFKDNTIFGVTGDLGTDTFVVDNVSREGIGCFAHATIEEINGEVWFLSEFGVYSISPSGLKERSAGIKPKFQSGNPFSFRQATAFQWTDNNKYILVMPSLSALSGENYFDSSTEVYVYDTFWGAWFQWNGFVGAGGFAEVGDRIYYIGRERNQDKSTVEQYLKRVHADGLDSDYADHEAAITFTYKTHWETLGEPSIFKKFLRIKAHSLDASLNDFETDQFSIDVTTEHNYEPNTISSLSLDFSGGALGWGNGPWGNFPWGETRLPSLKSKLASKKAKSLRVVFSNTALKENILISGYELEIAAPYAVELKE